MTQSIKKASHQSTDSDASRSTASGPIHPATASGPVQPEGPDGLQPVDENFLQQLRPGAHLFSADYTMYSVVDVPTENDIVLTQSFDEKEEKKSYTWDDLLTGQWWYNPEAPHKK